VAYGELGLRQKEYEESSPEYLTLAIEGKRNADTARTKETYEIARTLAYFSVSPHTKKNISPKKLWPFYWDEKTQGTLDWIKANKDKFEKLTLN